MTLSTWLKKQNELINIKKVIAFTKNKPYLSYIYTLTQEAIDCIPSIKFIPKAAIELYLNKKC